MMLAQVTADRGMLVAMTALLLSAAFTNNILLTRFLGMCPFLAISRQMKSAAGLGLAVTFVTTCTCTLNALLYHGVLKKIYDLHVTLRLILFIVIQTGSILTRYIKKAWVIAALQSVLLYLLILPQGVLFTF